MKKEVKKTQENYESVTNLDGTFLRVERLRNGGFTEYQIVEIVVAGGAVISVTRTQPNVLDIVLAAAEQAIHVAAVKNG